MHNLVYNVFVQSSEGTPNLSGAGTLYFLACPFFNGPDFGIYFPYKLWEVNLVWHVVAPPFAIPHKQKISICKQYVTYRPINSGGLSRQHFLLTFLFTLSLLDNRRVFQRGCSCRLRSSKL